MQDGSVVYSDSEYRARFPVREGCRLCRLEPVLWRTGEKNFYAKSGENAPYAESAEVESHAEGAENAGNEGRNGSTSRPEREEDKE